MLITKPIAANQRKKRYSKRIKKTYNEDTPGKKEINSVPQVTEDNNTNLTEPNTMAVFNKLRVDGFETNTKLSGISVKDKNRFDGNSRGQLKTRQRDSVSTYRAKHSTIDTSRPLSAHDRTVQPDLSLNSKQKPGKMIEPNPKPYSNPNPNPTHNHTDQARQEDINLNAKKGLGMMMADNSGREELTDVYAALGDLKKPQSNRAPLDFEKSPVLFYNPAGGWGKTVLGPLRMSKPKTGTLFTGNLFSANVTGQLRQELGLQQQDEAPLVDVGGRDAAQLSEVKGILIPSGGGKTRVGGGVGVGDEAIRRGSYVAYKVSTSGGEPLGAKDDTLPRRPPTTFDDVMKEPPPAGMRPPLDPEPTRRSMNDGHLRASQDASAPPYVSPGYDARGVMQAVGVIQAERMGRVSAGWRAGRCGDLETQLPTWVSPLYRPYGIGGPYGPHGPFYNCPQDPVDVIGRQKVKDALGVKNAAPKKCLRERFKEIFKKKKGASTKGDAVLVDLTPGKAASPRKTVAASTLAAPDAPAKDGVDIGDKVRDLTGDEARASASRSGRGSSLH